MKARLSLLYFLQFSVWGCYLTCFGQFLGAGGLGSNIAWFYAAIGLVSIITPSLLGRLA
ncbi:MAG: MFS transporter, partial [Muribaculaceae bacterium]|nr:MFS transporter [Muribaculaceae bacterium]